MKSATRRLIALAECDQFPAKLCRRELLPAGRKGGTDAIMLELAVSVVPRPRARALDKLAILFPRPGAEAPMTVHDRRHDVIMHDHPIALGIG